MPRQLGKCSQQAPSIPGPEVRCREVVWEWNNLSAGLGSGGDSLTLSLLLTQLNGKGSMIQEVFPTSSPLLCFGCTKTFPRCLGFLHRCYRAQSCSSWSTCFICCHEKSSTIGFLRQGAVVTLLPGLSKPCARPQLQCRVLKGNRAFHELDS